MFIKLLMNKELIKKLRRIDKDIDTNYYTEYINFAPSKEFYEKKLADYKKMLDIYKEMKIEDSYTLDKYKYITELLDDNNKYIEFYDKSIEWIKVMSALPNNINIMICMQSIYKLKTCDIYSQIADLIISFLDLGIVVV